MRGQNKHFSPDIRLRHFFIQRLRSRYYSSSSGTIWHRHIFLRPALSLHTFLVRTSDFIICERSPWHVLHSKHGLVIRRCSAVPLLEAVKGLRCLLLWLHSMGQRLIFSLQNERRNISSAQDCNLSVFSDQSVLVQVLGSGFAGFATSPDAMMESSSFATTAWISNSNLQCWVSSGGGLIFCLTHLLIE